MHRSTDRILTTHVGSLIRPESVRRHLRAKQKGEGYDPAAHAQNLKDTVAEVVRQQAEAGVDVVSDGEFGKGISWSQYVIERRLGFRAPAVRADAGNPFTRGADRKRFSEFYKELDARDHVADGDRYGRSRRRSNTPARRCSSRTSTISRRRSRARRWSKGFLPVAAPASVIPDRKNEYYKNEDDLPEAIGTGDACRIQADRRQRSSWCSSTTHAPPSPTTAWCRPASYQGLSQVGRLYQMA